MPAAGGIKKSELYLDSPVKRAPVLCGNPVLPVLQPVNQLLQICSYVLLWKQPPLSAYVFIWLNLSILCHVAFGLTTLLSTTLTILLLISNVVMLEYTFTKSNMMSTLLCVICGIDNLQLVGLPGSPEVSAIIVNSINSVCDVMLNIRESSQNGATQFWFSLCSTVAMITIILTYLASTTTLLLLFWFLFCYPAFKYHSLYNKITQEQIVATFNMSCYMIYNTYLAVVRAFSTAELEISPGATGQVEFEASLHDEYDREMSEPATSYRATTMSYLRGLPTVMTLNWNRISTWRSGSGALPAPSPSSQRTTESTEEDSDYGIDDIEEDRVPAKITEVTTHAGTLDTLGSDADLQFPSIDRKDTLEDGTLTLAAGLDPNLLYDEDCTEFTAGMSEFGFTLGRNEELNLLDAVHESDDDLERDGPTEPSPSPEFGASIVSSNVTRDNTLDGRQFSLSSLFPTPPANPKPEDLSPFRQQRLKQDSVQTEDSEFYVISDEDIQAADEDLSSHESGTSPRRRVLSDNPRI